MLKLIRGKAVRRLLIWNEGEIRSPCEAAALARDGCSSLGPATLLLSAYVDEMNELVPEQLTFAHRSSGIVQLEQPPDAPMSIHLARDLALSMGLSVWEPGWRTHASVDEPTRRMTQVIVRMLQDGACASARFCYPSIQLVMTRRREGMVVLRARAFEENAKHAVRSAGFRASIGRSSRLELTVDPAAATDTLLLQLRALRRWDEALGIVLDAPRLHAVE
jgi:hypothetical protein